LASFRVPNCSNRFGLREHVGQGRFAEHAAVCDDRVDPGGVPDVGEWIRVEEHEIR
jgi:hypothetical protein